MTQDILSTNLVSPDEATTTNALDLSGVDSPFDNFNGINLQTVQDKNKILDLQDVNNIATTDQTTSPVVDDKKPKTKQQLLNEVNNLDQYQRARAKSFSENFGAIASQYRDPAFAYGDYEFDRYKTNVDRYLGLGKSTFKELGFNPLEDNETYYNKKVSGYKDWLRMAGQFGGLFASSFTGTYRSIGNILEGKSVLTADLEGNAEFERANRIGQSSRGGLNGFGVNLALNAAFTIGTMANIVTEELAIATLAGLSPETGGASGALAATLQTAEEASIVAKLNKLRQTLAAGLSYTSVGSITKGSYQMLKSLYRVDEAKNFWQGAKMFGQGVNPFRQLTEFGVDAYKGTEAYKNLSNLAKVSRGFGSFYRDVREGMFTINESQLEGAGVTQDQINTLIDGYTKQNGKLPEGEDLNNIYRNAYAAGKVDILGNLPLIYFTNRITFDGLFKFKGIKSLIEAAEKTVPNFGKNFVLDIGEKGFVEATKEGLFKTSLNLVKNPKRYIGSFLNYTKHNFTEGLQEIGQEWLSDAVKRRYTSIYNSPAIAQSDLLKTGLWSQLGSTIISKESGEAIKAQIFSQQGFSTFLSGFLMGGLIGGAQGGLTKVANNVWNKSAELYLKSSSPEKFEQYKKSKEELKAKHLEILNKLLSNAEDVFSRKKESFIEQKNILSNLDNAEQVNDDKSFYDNKDAATFDHVFSSLDAGTFDTLIKGMEELGKLNDQELADYFNLDNGAKAKEKLTEYVGRAKQIKERYDAVNDKFKNPFDPKKYKRGTTEQINEFIAYKSFEDAKKEAIASQYGFERSVERLEGIYQDLIKEKPLKSTSESSYNILLNPNLIKKEIALLNEEAKLLSESTQPGDKKLATKKQRIAEALAEYLENYNNHKKGDIKPKEENGQFTIPFSEETINPLKKSYIKYLKAIADVNEDYIFNDSIDKSFDKILDYYDLKDDAKRYTNTINYLSNPENLIRHAERINIALNDLYENRLKLSEEAIDHYFSDMELNNLILNVGMLGVVINPEELIDLAKTGKLPESFFDLKNNKLIDNKDPRYEKLLSMVEIYKKLRETDLPEEEEIKEEEEKQQPEPEKKEEKKQPISSELEKSLRDAYVDFIAETGSDISYEEFVDGHPTAHLLKKKAEKGEPEEKVIEVKLPEIEIVKEEEPTAEEKKEETPTASTSDIEAKKADIEKRRKEKLKKLYKESVEKEDREALDKIYNSSKIGDQVQVGVYVFTKTAEDEWTSSDDVGTFSYSTEKMGNVYFDIEYGKNKASASLAFFAAKLNLGKVSLPQKDIADLPLIKEILKIEEEAKQELDALEGKPAESVEEQKVKVETKEQKSIEKINNILDDVKNLSEFPALNLNDNSEVSKKLLELITKGEATSDQVLELVKTKYDEILKNLTPESFIKGDIVIFTDGRKGIVNQVSKDSIKVKVFNTPSGEFTIINKNNLSTMIATVKTPQEAIADEKETPSVEISTEDKQAIDKSQNTADSLITDSTKAKNIISEGIKDAGTEEDLGFDDLPLGCDE